jgi:tRNA pseudouridine38-40 synthase
MNVKLTLSYDGTDFYGFQAQENLPTVAGEIEKALQKILGEIPEIVCAGRTDKGVHADGQVINFHTSLDKMKEYNWLRALNSILPRSVRITQCEFMPDEWSARFDAKAREYHYHLVNQRFPDARRMRFASFCYYDLDVELLNQYCQYLVGEHDFTSFCAADDPSRTKIRQIYKLDTMRNDDLVTLRVIGSAFLHNMVRIITGTLLTLYRKGEPPIRMKQILDGQNRQLTRDTIEPHGLVFKKVYYDEKEIPQ